MVWVKVKFFSVLCFFLFFFFKWIYGYCCTTGCEDYPFSIYLPSHHFQNLLIIYLWIYFCVFFIIFYWSMSILTSTLHCLGYYGFEVSLATGTIRTPTLFFLKIDLATLSFEFPYIFYKHFVNFYKRLLGFWLELHSIPQFGEN